MEVAKVSHHKLVPPQPVPTPTLQPYLKPNISPHLVVATKNGGSPAAHNTIPTIIVPKDSSSKSPSPTPVHIRGHSSPAPMTFHERSYSSPVDTMVLQVQMRPTTPQPVPLTPVSWRLRTSDSPPVLCLVSSLDNQVETTSCPMIQHWIPDMNEVRVSLDQ